ncbi:hypothetical protein WK28_22995 [Burkholderia vietnamiensis]|nr:hypothetical protein WK28_22995 [Burkholderia vietnamiensis]
MAVVEPREGLFATLSRRSLVRLQRPFLECCRRIRASPSTYFHSALEDHALTQPVADIAFDSEFTDA